MKKVLLAAMAATVLMASEEGFDLAPTPVSQSEVKAGEVENMFRATLINSSIDVGDDTFDISGFGAQFAKKEGTSDGATNKSGTIMTLSGSSDTLDTTVVSVNAAYLWEKYNTTQDGSRFTIFYGGDFSYTYSNAYNEDFELDIYMMLYGGTLGIQYNIHSGEVIISPFAVAKYLFGSYESEIWVGDGYASQSDSIDPMLTQSFGFDVYFKSLGSTLSAMVKSDSSSQTTILSYAWFW
jgi:hypothetical protein